MMLDIILNKLDDIERKENVKIIYAVESGSRAWDFDSQDSDYDVRFIYVRPLNDYLSLENIKDTIDYELNDVFDINGWDLKKALKLLYKSNPTLYEWKASPIVYKKTMEWDMIDEAFEQYFQIQRVLHHYYHMSFHEYKNVQTLKQFLYCLRTLLCCLWIIEYQSPPPIELNKLLFLLPDYLHDTILEILTFKKNNDEHYSYNPDPTFNRYIEEQLNYIGQHLLNPQNNLSFNLLNQTFVDILKTLSL